MMTMLANLFSFLPLVGGLVLLAFALYQASE